jgi:hypothetical protein
MIIATIQLISYMPIMEHTIYYNHHVGRKYAQQLNHKIISLKKNQFIYSSQNMYLDFK